MAWTSGCLLLAAVAPLAAQEAPLRGGAFDFTGVFGQGSFQDKTQLNSCAWFGARIGHRFAPFPGNERIQMGVRTGFEACSTQHPEAGQLDIIHLNLTVLAGFRVSRSLMLYWGTGFGELLDDTTVGSGGTVDARFAGHTGPGVTWAVGNHLILDASVKGIVFEDFALGTSPAGGSTLGLVPSVSVGFQI